jgi:hypothetical protein
MATRLLLASLLAFSTAMAQTLPTKAEIDDARDANRAFTAAIVKFRKAENWAPLVDELETSAKHYVGKSKIQIATLDREFPDAPSEMKVKASLMVAKLDAAAAQAIRFSQAYRKATAFLRAEDAEHMEDEQHVVAYAKQAETERLRFISAAKDFARAALDFTETAKK